MIKFVPVATACLVRKAKAVPELMSPLKIWATQAAIARTTVSPAIETRVRVSPITSSTKLKFARQSIRTMQRQPLWTQTDIKAKQYKEQTTVTNSSLSDESLTIQSNLEKIAIKVKVDPEKWAKRKVSPVTMSYKDCVPGDLLVM